MQPLRQPTSGERIGVIADTRGLLRPEALLWQKSVEHFSPLPTAVGAVGRRLTELDQDRLPDSW